VFTYIAGTTTKKNTYTTAAESVTNTNPIILDSNGECDLWYATGSYKVVLAPADDTDPPTNALWTVDNFDPSTDALASIITGTSVGGFVNYFNARNAATGNAPRLTATGDGTDANVSMEIETTGTGTINLLAPVNVTGNTAVTGTLTSSGAITATTGGVIATTGDLTISSGNASISGTLASGAMTSTGVVTAVDYVRVSGNSSNAGGIRLYEDTDNGTNYTQIRGAASQSADKTVILPSSWTDGQFVQCAVAGDTITLSTAGVGSSNTLPYYHLAGLNTAHAADTDHDITIAVGQCKSADNGSDMTLASAITKQIDAVWAEGTNAGGRASGVSLSNTTWYHLFVILKNDGTTVDAGFDTSLTATNLLADATSYTDYRRVASVLTDGSANIRGYFQTGGDFYWKAVGGITDYTTSSPSTGLKTLTIPQVYAVEAKILQYNATAAEHVVYHTSGGTQASYAMACYPIQYASGDVYTTTGQIYLQASGSGSTNIYTNGWYDWRGTEGSG
jgi:hypothetical protein